MENKKNDLKIYGDGSASGGVYDEAIIRGHGRINSDLECVHFECDGMSDIHGEMKAKNATVRGKAEIDGTLEADELRVYGQIGVIGNAMVKDIKIEGKAVIQGGCTGEAVEVKGALKVGGDCNAEFFTAKGTFTIDGLLNAGSIDAELYGNSRAREIGGERISLRQGKAFGLKRFLQSLFVAVEFNDGLVAEIIEGDDVELEYTRAKVVRGNNVQIGTGCDIALVEYKNSFHQAEGAKVAEQKKLE